MDFKENMSSWILLSTYVKKKKIMAAYFSSSSAWVNNMLLTNISEQNCWDNKKGLIEIPTKSEIA